MRFKAAACPINNDIQAGNRVMYGSKVKRPFSLKFLPGGGTFIDKSAISNEARCQKPSNLLRRRIKGATLRDL